MILVETILKRLSQFPTQLFLIVIGALLFLPLLGTVHLFDWDEINFAESAREMLLTHNYRMVQIDFHPFYEKPPFFIWLQALSMKYFGVNEFAARLPNALCGILTMLAVFNAGREVFKSQLGVLWALLFACSILPHFYFKSGIIDPVFNLLIFSGIYYMYRVSVINEFEPYKEHRRKQRMYLVLSGLFIGLATLTKGPVAVLITVLTGVVYLVANRGKLKIEFSQGLTWLTIVTLVIVAWLSFEVRANGIKFIDEFITYQIRLFKTEDAGHGGPIWYHFVILLIGVFPASALIFYSFRKNEHDDDSQAGFKKWMIYLLCVVLLIFSVVKTKIVHYSSLCYFPITFLAAYYLNYLFDRKATWTWKQTAPLMVIGVSIASAITAGILLIQRKHLWVNYVTDEFAAACLEAVVYWRDIDVAIGAVYIVCIIAAILLIQTRHIKWAVYLLLISSAVFITTMMTVLVPRVEKYSQAALIEFLESKQNENCIVEPAGFKSYAHYFYARKPANLVVDSTTKKYLICKQPNAANLHNWYGDIHELYRKNGWVFFEMGKGEE